MEFYSSRIKLALLLGPEVFFFLHEWWILWWLWNVGLVYPSLLFFLFFVETQFAVKWTFFLLDMTRVSVIRLPKHDVSHQKSFVPVSSKPNHILASECLYTQVYGETFKQHWVGTDCLGFGSFAALMADSSSNFDYTTCQHITIGGHFCPFWCSDKKIGNTLSNFDHTNLYVSFLSTEVVCVSFNDGRNASVYSNVCSFSHGASLCTSNNS